MPHNEMLPECQERFKTMEKHVEESPNVRDMVVRHDTQIKIMVDNIAALADLKKTIIGSSTTVIITVMLAALALAVTWGRTIEKVERLDRIHIDEFKKTGG